MVACRRFGSSGSRQRDYYRIEDEDGHRYWVFREGLYRESERGALPGICTACSGDGVAMRCRYAELEVTTNFSFRAAAPIRGAGGDGQGARLAAIAVTDRNTLAGVVRAHLAAKEVGIKFIVGVRLDLDRMRQACSPIPPTAPLTAGSASC